MACLLGLAVALLASLPGAPARAQGRHGPVAWGSLVPSCSYSGQTLTRLKVTPPKASMDKALARKGGRSQYVGVSVTLQGLSGASWKNVTTRPAKGGYAATVLVHPRRKTSVKHAALMTFADSALRAAYSSFRVRVTLKWYAYDGRHVRGTVSRTTSACARIRPYATRIQAGDGYACALMSDRTVRCWGEGTSGQLGDGSMTTRSRPQVVPGLSSVVSLSAGDATACAALAAGGVRCWGANASGQVGDGTMTTRSRPTAVSGAAGATQVWGGYGTTCASSWGSALKCWGVNSTGQVGDSSKAAHPAPWTVPGTTSTYTVAVSMGKYSSCRVNSSLVAECWGMNNSEQIGIAPASGTVYGPTRIAGPSDLTQIASGWSTNCALAGGAVKCWGYNAQGELGTGSTATASATPTTPLASGVSSLSAYYATVCAVRSGQVYCWGGNLQGQDGQGDTTTYGTPHLVRGPAGVVGVAVGARSVYAWDAAGHVWAWGDNSYGQLGTGDTTNHLTPVAVSIH